ncbi:zinc finger, AN1-type domain [Coemansia sp. RSA 2599]|nr:zinc finger, AN1-type domain [Coemansia sp. RSA 2599]
MLPARSSYHGQVDKHKCSKKDEVVDRRVPECPICGKPVTLRPNDSADDAVARHIDSGCKSGNNGNNPASRPKCAYNGCTDKSVVRTTCRFCSRPYCLQHRFGDVHGCPQKGSSAPPSSNVGAKAIDVMSGVFGRSRSEHKQSPQPPAGTAARNAKNSASARKPSSASTKAKDSSCIIS